MGASMEQYKSIMEVFKDHTKQSSKLMAQICFKIIFSQFGV
jgi:hypothetical protein